MSDHLPTAEASRLAALHALDILDTPAEARFDRFTRLAALSFDVPIALISMTGAERQWFKSRCGMAAQELPRSIAFCSHAVALRDMLVVEDAALDARFADNPLVAGADPIRFYAGQPIYSEGEAVGTLCLIDRAPRAFSDEQRACLRDLASLVEAELNHAKVATARLMAEQALKSLNTDLERRVQLRTAELADKVDELSREIDKRKASESALQETEDWNRTIVASCYSGFVGSNEAGAIVEWNAAAERTFGWQRAQALGKTFSELVVPPAARTAYKEARKAYFEGGDTAILERKIELPAMTASGRQITVEMTISAYQWQGQRCLGAFMTDISERLRTQVALEEKQELLDAVLESIDVGVVTSDAVGNLTLFNRAARAMLAHDLTTAAPAEWARHYAMFHVDRVTPLAMHEVPLVRALQGESVVDQPMTLVPGGGGAHTLLTSARPLRSASGRRLGAVATMKNITELNASQERLAANERRLRAITENLPAMIGKVSAAGKFEFLNSRALHVYGKSASELLGHGLESAYTAQDLAKIQPYIERVGAGEQVAFEYLTQAKGRDIHYQCCFVPQRTENGSPDGFFAMAVDISERKLGELRQAESEERLRTITDNVPVLIAHLDSERRYSFANAVHQSWLGKTGEQVRGSTMEEAFGSAYHGPQAQALEQAWRGQAAQCEHEIVRGKFTRTAHSTFLPQLRDGAVVGVYVLTTDATASRMHERHLHALAHTDTLTSLPNRREFEAAIADAAARPFRAAKGIALLYLDIDHFKQINDRHGHATGDAVLVEFARRLGASVRGSDLVARIAGDEFTVLLNDVHADSDVELVARKILAALRQPFVLGRLTLDVSATIGAALADAPGATPKALAEVADRALYAAKGAGRATYAILRLSQAGQTAVAALA
jgi:diguanylate cyclase (GGDEF)-like protein/PAS domain S-box-containing protein